VRIVHRFVAVALAACVAVLGGCSGGSSPAQTLTVMAGSEVKDLEPLFADLEKSTGVHLDVTYSGTLAGIDKIENTTSASDAPDVAWFSQAKYLDLTDTKHVVKTSSKTMLSPVVLGVKESKARELGWIGKPVTWSQIEAAAGAGKLRYAMTNPTTSNSGFSAVVAVATALTGSGDAVRADQINGAKLTQFFAGQKLAAGSSGWLADAYVKSQDDLDGMINYESVLLGLNAGGTLHEKLYLVYPTDGVVTADYPFMLLNDQKRAAYDKVVAYLRSPDAQRRIMETTYRRPIDPSIALLPVFPKNVLVETQFPNSRAAVDTILLAYLNKHRIPAHAYFVLDTSGSMNGERLQSVQKALHILAGDDDSLTGKFARFDDREEVTFITFNSRVTDQRTWTMHGVNDPATFGEIGRYADGLTAGGNTAIYDALDVALDEAQKEPAGRYPSIVLMTDGENNSGEDARDFLSKYQSRAVKVRIFPVFIGEADPKELGTIADASGGRAFDARSLSLPEIFKDIRGYQ